MNNSKIFSSSSNTGLEKKAHQIHIEFDRRTTKRSNQEKGGGERRRVDLALETLSNQLLELQTRVKIQIRETCHGSGWTKSSEGDITVNGETRGEGGDSHVWFSRRSI
jgi:hypothetical protein